MPNKSFTTACAVLATLCAALGYAGDSAQPAGEAPEAAVSDLATHVAIGWNDLGMHCMNDDYQSIAVLPPYNTIQLQVIQRGVPPVLVDSGVELTYRFIGNTYSVGKTNFWQYAKQLFGVTLPNDVGLTGRGLTGTMEWKGQVWEAAGIPLVPFDDATPTIETPYQLAEVELSQNGTTLDTTTFVVPVSTELHCDKCHANDKQGEADSGRAVNPVYLNILREHDEEEGTNLEASQPVLCASCHASNALGTPGAPGVKPLSQAIHSFHGREASSSSCYDCHPGERTRCFRDAMLIADKWCTDCHGSLREVGDSVGSGRRPWLDEPKCADCHDADHEENASTLYRNSFGHGGVACAGCHGSPHAILPTVEARDSMQVMRLQGNDLGLRTCTVCHVAEPDEAGPHGILTARYLARRIDGNRPMPTEYEVRADYNEDGSWDVGDVIFQKRRGL